MATLSARRGVRTGRSQYASGDVWKKLWKLFRDREGRVRRPEGVLRRVLGEDGALRLASAHERGVALAHGIALGAVRLIACQEYST